MTTGFSIEWDERDKSWWVHAWEGHRMNATELYPHDSWYPLAYDCTWQEMLGPARVALAGLRRALKA